MLFVIVGVSKHTADPDYVGEWVDENGIRIYFVYTERHVIASGNTEQELLESAGQYAALSVISEK